MRKLARELQRPGHRASHRMVAELLPDGYSLQANGKAQGGTSHPDRNAPFEYLNRKVRHYLAQKPPMISADTEKLELAGNFKNGGRELRPNGEPEKVRVHDFVIPEFGRARPYGITIWRETPGGSAWTWITTRRPLPGRAPPLVALEGAAGLSADDPTVHHCQRGPAAAAREHDCGSWSCRSCRTKPDCASPSVTSRRGTRKWNKIEHRPFSFITQNWRDKPFISHEDIENLIASTTQRAESPLGVGCSELPGTY